MSERSGLGIVAVILSVLALGTVGYFNVVPLFTSDSGGSGTLPASQARVERRTTDQTFPTDTNTLVEFNYATFDPGNNYDTVNHYYIAPIDGYYLLTSAITIENQVAEDKIYLVVYVDGIAGANVQSPRGSQTDRSTMTISDIIWLDKDSHLTLEVYVDPDGTPPASTRNIVYNFDGASNYEWTYLAISLIGY